MRTKGEHGLIRDMFRDISEYINQLVQKHKIEI